MSELKNSTTDLLPFIAGRAGVGGLAPAGGCVQQAVVEAGGPRLERPRHRARVLRAEAAGPIRGEYSVVLYTINRR